MKHELISAIEQILESNTSIKLHVDKIEELRKQLDEILTDSEKITLINNIRARVQEEVDRTLYGSKDWGAVFMATGSGKSKIAVDRASSIVHWNPDAKILLSVPTEKLRDENWHDEFVKWGAEAIWNNNVIRCCYASLNKFQDEAFDYVILDEGHNITEYNSEFFAKNKVERCLLLTATEPKDAIKLQILKDLNINCVYRLSLDESVKLGLVAPYDITVVTINLDTVDKYIKAGSKAKPFLNTEKGQYGYLSTRLTAMPNKMGFIERMRFIYNLKSKTEAAKWLLENVIPKESRTLIFCGSKRQAIEVCDRRYFSKPTLKKHKGKETAATIRRQAEREAEYKYILSNWEGDAGFNEFKSGIINRMSCCEAINEGHNIPGVDIGFIIQLNSNELDFIQRIGRILRFRPGHRGKIIVLCCKDTVDKDWVKKATENLSVSNITYVELSRLKVGIETILID